MRARARILHVITRMELGGAQRNTLHTCAHLDRDRFEVGLAWGVGDELDSDAEALQGVELFPLPDLVRPVAPGSDFNAYCQLRAVMRSFAPDVVHTHSSKAGILGRLAARHEAVPVVVHSIHGFGFTPVQAAPVRALFLVVERVAGRWTDHFVAVSRANMAVGVELGLFAPDRVSLIRSGIDLGRFRGASGGEACRRRLGLPVDAPVVVQVGNFKPQKAPLDFVQVAARVVAEVPAAHFVMPGDGPLRGAAQSLAASLGIGRQLTFCGWWDDVPSLLAASDVSVLTSRHEGLPRAVVESLAAGVPVVATAVDGTPEVVAHGVNGFLAEAGDVAALARWVTALLQQPRLRQRLARASSHGLEDFDIDLMVRRQEDLYTCLLGRSRS